ncbi:MAG: class I SAM-dependent methyltransferase [Hyphomicrobiaceae bacterium]
MTIPPRPLIHGPADAPTSVVIRALEALDTGARPLVVDEGSGKLAAMLQARGAAPQIWRRFAMHGGTATPWPLATEATSALVRLGKDRRALAMALHAAASVVVPGGAMVLFGANAEGVKSAGKTLEDVAEGIVTVDTRRHSRVLAGRRRAEIAGLRPTLDAWREVHEVEINGRRRSWVSYPGVFAGGALDAGTALLIAHLPALGRGAAVLDMACGSGLIGAAVRELGADVAVDLVDSDAVAIAAARENVPGATAICGDGLAAAPRHRYDAILSNPPIHDGVSESLAFLQRLIAEAPARLQSGGLLQVVIQSRIRALPWFEAAFREAAVIAQDRRYQVIRGVAASAGLSRRGAR